MTLAGPSLPSPADTPPWETVADRTALPLDALEFSVRLRARVRRAPSWQTTRARRFPAGRPLLEAVLELTRRIHEEFTFDPRGDHRHDAADGRFQVAARRVSGLRAAGDRVPAVARTAGPVRQRVSRDRSAPGRPATARRRRVARLAGVYCPRTGWIHVDPTNNLLPSDRHVTVAWGRDYSDVSPIHGVILGGGKHALRVNVDVVRLAES